MAELVDIYTGRSVKIIMQYTKKKKTGMNTNHNLLSKHNATMGKQKQLTFIDSADAPYE